MKVFRHLRHRQLVDWGQAAPELVADLLQAAGHLRGVEAGGHHLDVTVTYCICGSRFIKSQGQIRVYPSTLISCVIYSLSWVWGRSGILDDVIFCIYGSRYTKSQGQIRVNPSFCSYFIGIVYHEFEEGLMMRAEQYWISSSRVPVAQMSRTSHGGKTSRIGIKAGGHHLKNSNGMTSL